MSLLSYVVSIVDVEGGIFGVFTPFERWIFWNSDNSSGEKLTLRMYFYASL
jgi:hypothetical protein